MGVEIRMPKNGINYFKIIDGHGFPNRFIRSCCRELKEYKILDKAVIGIRKCESRSRKQRYTEPTACRVFDKTGKTERAEHVYPILEWTDKDVEEFIVDRKIKCAPVYYDEEGNFHVERRLGCMACPLTYYKKRLETFKKYPKLVRAYIRHGMVYWSAHPDSNVHKRFKDVYEQFVCDCFYKQYSKYIEDKDNIVYMQGHKKFLEEYFGIDLTIKNTNKEKE